MGNRSLALLVLFAITLGSLAAGTPVNGDPSVRAETAGINLGHRVESGARSVAAATSNVRAALTAHRPALVTTAGWRLASALASLRPPWWGWRDRHTSRGPPGFAIPDA